MKTNNDIPTGISTREGRAKAVEGTAVFGLLLVMVGIGAPTTQLLDPTYLRVFKWIYAAGALIFTIARVVGSMDKEESVALRRARRLEFWAGAAFIIGAAFWFYKEHHLPDVVGTLAVLRDTILFTLVGAAIQVVASLIITRRLKKEGAKKE